MPLTVSKKGGGTKKRSFQELVSDLKRQGKSDISAKKIAGTIQKKQESKGIKKTSKKR